jgi:hypothetical protein
MDMERKLLKFQRTWHNKNELIKGKLIAKKCWNIMTRSGISHR